MNRFALIALTALCALFAGGYLYLFTALHEARHQAAQAESKFAELAQQVEQLSASAQVAQLSRDLAEQKERNSMLEQQLAKAARTPRPLITTIVDEDMKILVHEIIQSERTEPIRIREINHMPDNRTGGALYVQEFNK